jgi:hypothetical protein
MKSMYYSPWKNFALYRKFGKIRKYDPGSFATPHPFQPFNSILGCFTCLTLFILLPRYRYRFNSLSFQNFSSNFLFFGMAGGFRKIVRPNKGLADYIFIASSLYTDLTRGFFYVYFVDFLPRRHISRIFLLLLLFSYYTYIIPSVIYFIRLLSILRQDFTHINVAKWT